MAVKPLSYRSSAARHTQQMSGGKAAYIEEFGGSDKIKVRSP
jgi:hypothetical protein